MPSSIAGMTAKSLLAESPFEEMSAALKDATPMLLVVFAESKEDAVERRLPLPFAYAMAPNAKIAASVTTTAITTAIAGALERLGVLTLVPCAPYCGCGLGATWRGWRCGC